MPMTAPMSNLVGSPVGAVVSSTARLRRDSSHGDSHDDPSILVRGLSRAIRVKIASKRDEFEQAFRMIAERYKAKGYDRPDSGPYHFTPYHTLPGTVTFVAKDGDRVVATLSMVPDNDVLGLPMESIYGDEVAALRRENRAARRGHQPGRGWAHPA